MTYSYKRGLPEDKTGNYGGFVFDCRAMPNPCWDESLRGYTGRDKPIAALFARHMPQGLVDVAFCAWSRLWYNTQ